MARISVDIEQISKNLKETADKAKVQLTDLAKKVEKDLADNEQVQKLLDQGLKLAMKAGATAAELRKELEKRLGKTPEEIVKNMRSKFEEAAEEVKKTVVSASGTSGAKTKKRTTKKTATTTAETESTEE